MERWVVAEGATYEAREALRAEGFRWFPGRKLWALEMSLTDSELRSLERAFRHFGFEVSFRLVRSEWIKGE